MSWDDAIMEGFWVFQDDEYAKFCMCKHYARFSSQFGLVVVTLSTVADT